MTAALIVVGLVLLVGFGAAVFLCRRYARECEQWARYCADVEERIDAVVQEFEDERRDRTDAILTAPQFSGTLDDSPLATRGQRERAGGKHALPNEPANGRTTFRPNPL